MSPSIALIRIFDLIYLILIVDVFLSWIPNINRSKQPFLFIRAFAEVFFAPFRKIIPPIGMLDISPIVCFLFLGVLRYLLLWIFGNIGI